MLLLLQKKPLIWKHRRVLSFAKRTGSCKLEEVLSYYQAGGERLANFLIIEFSKPQFCLT
jgi:hypothetical protein